MRDSRQGGRLAWPEALALHSDSAAPIVMGQDHCGLCDFYSIAGIHPLAKLCVGWDDTLTRHGRSRSDAWRVWGPSFDSRWHLRGSEEMETGLQREGVQGATLGRSRAGGVREGAHGAGG